MSRKHFMTLFFIFISAEKELCWSKKAEIILFRRHIVLACCEKGHLVTLYTTLFFRRLSWGEWFAAQKIQTTVRKIKRHNLDKNKDADATRPENIVRWSPPKRKRNIFASQHRLQDNWTHFQGHSGVIHLFVKRESEQPEQNHTRAIGQSKKQLLLFFVSPSFYVIYYSCFFLFFSLPFFAFSFYYDKKGVWNEEDHLHVWWFQRPMASSGATWCNELESRVMRRCCSLLFLPFPPSRNLS